MVNASALLRRASACSDDSDDDDDDDDGCRHRTKSFLSVSSIRIETDAERQFYDSFIQAFVGRTLNQQQQAFPGLHAGARALPDMEAFPPITVVPTRGIGPGRDCFRVSPGIYRMGAVPGQ